MADAETRPETRLDLELRLEFDSVYLAGGLAALAHLVETSRDLPSAEQLGFLIKHSAAYAEAVKEQTVKLLYPQDPRHQP